MRKTVIRIILISLVILLMSATGLTFSAPMDLVGFSKSFGDGSGENGYVIGSYKMLHTQWGYLDRGLQNPEEISTDCKFWLELTIENTATGEKADLELKPISGSNVVIYKSQQKKLLKNDSDPYWVLKLPPGNYQITTVTFRLAADKVDYRGYKTTVFSVPASRDLKRNVNFELKRKQIVYIGDYMADFKTNIILSTGSYRTDYLSFYNQMKLSLNNNFEETKNILGNAIGENKKEKLKEFEIVSAI